VAGGTACKVEREGSRSHRRVPAHPLVLENTRYYFEKSQNEIVLLTMGMGRFFKMIK